MSIITLTSDHGNKDFYIPATKGYILSRIPDAKIVDISHSIEPFDIAAGSFILKGCYKDFPADAIHIVSIDASSGDTPYIAVRTKHGIFLAHNNGIISLILDGEPPLEVYSISHKAEDRVFQLRDVFAAAAIRLLKGEALSSLGEEVKDYYTRANLLPMTEDNIIRGTIIYIDNFGNAITNIHKSVFEKYAQGKRFFINVTPRERVTKISENYAGNEGEIMCLFSSTGYLEIAQSHAKVYKLIGHSIGSIVSIEFE